MKVTGNLKKIKTRLHFKILEINRDWVDNLNDAEM